MAKKKTKTRTNKSAEKIDYSYTKDKKNKSGKWQLRVDYQITEDRIKVKPYVVITGDGLKESKLCTIKCEYKYLKKSGKYPTSGWDNKWVTTSKSSTHKVKDEGTHKIFFADKKGNAQWVSLKTFVVYISAKIGSHVSKTTIYGSKKPTRPQLVTVGNTTYGLEHNVNDPYVWRIWFEYEPKGSGNDYAAPVDDWWVSRQADSPTANWDQIGHKNAKHDVNGFREIFPNQARELEAGHRYKWKVTFSNDAGSSSRIYPPNKENNVETVKDSKGNNKTRAITQLDKLKEWAFTPPAQLGSINALRQNKGVRLTWERDPIKAYDGIYRGYFFQVIKDKKIDKVSGLKNNEWSWISRVNDDRKLVKYLEEKQNPQHVSDYDRTLTAKILLEDNHRYMLRVVPFNYDKGVRPNTKNITYGKGKSKHIQEAVPSEATEVIYFKPCKADSVKAVYNEDEFINVTINYKSASGGSVNCARIFRRYRFADNTTSDWIECWYDGSSPPTPGTEGITLTRNEETDIFEDLQAVPTEYDGKKVTGIKYSVELGVNEEGAFAPSGDDRFADKTIMDGWVSNLKKPDKPTLLFPEDKKAYPETTEYVTFTWAHNPTDGTGQQAAKLDIFVFDSSVSIPSDFFSYPIWTSDHDARNTVSIDDDSAFYNMSFSDQIYKITDVDTTQKTVTCVQTNFSPNDKILWRVATKGTYEQYSDFSTEQRTFNIFGAPSIELKVKTPNNVDVYYNIDRTEFESDWLWVYSDGSLSPAQTSVGKQYKIVGWCDNLGDYATGEDASGYSYLGKDLLWNGVNYVLVEYSTTVITQIPTTVSWEYTDLSGTLQALNLYLVSNDNVVESYSVDLTEDNEYTFSYLFDNDEMYSIVAEATSSTTLTATEDISFLVSYTTVELSKMLSVSADFDESTGFAILTLSEDVDEGTEDDNLDIEISEGGSDVLRAGTAFRLYFEHTYEDGRLIVKSLLDKPLNYITIACSVNVFNPSTLFPNDDIYPSESVYPQKAVSTNNTDTDYVLFDEYIGLDPGVINLYVSVPENKGLIYAPDAKTTALIQLNYITGEYTYEGEQETTVVEFPIRGTIYDDFDIVDQPDIVETEDEVATDVYLYRYYRNTKTYIGHFTPNFEDDETIVATIFDRFCPINNEFEYQLIQVTESGHISYSSVAVQFNTLYWYCYWGPTYDNVAKARWNPSGSASYSRPERQSVRYSGRQYPVVYDSDAIEETYSFSVELIEDDYMIDNMGDDETALETIDLYRQLMLDGGVGFWKSFSGDVYFATFDFSYSVDYKDRIKKYPCSLSVTRIEGNEVF